MDKQEYVGHISPILPTNFVKPEHYQEFIEYENTMLNWLDGQIRQSVAQEIIKDYENAFEPTVPMSITYEKHRFYSLLVDSSSIIAIWLSVYGLLYNFLVVLDITSRYGKYGHHCLVGVQAA